MSSDSEKIADLLRQQIEVEQRTLGQLMQAEQEASEPAVKLVFMDVRLDTAKHAQFLQGIVDLLDQTPCDEWSAKVQRYADRVKLGRKLRDIVTEEGSMSDLVSRALKLTDDRIAQLLLTHLKEDEQKHSKTLSEIARSIQTMPLQSKKGQKGTDIVCKPEK